MARKQQDPISPGEILFEEFMQPLDISIYALARDLSAPPNRISEIANGKRAITADTALRLAPLFRTQRRTLAQPADRLRAAGRATRLRGRHQCASQIAR